MRRARAPVRRTSRGRVLGLVDAGDRAELEVLGLVDAGDRAELEVLGLVDASDRAELEGPRPGRHRRAPAAAAIALDDGPTCYSGWTMERPSVLVGTTCRNV